MDFKERFDLLRNKPYTHSEEKEALLPFRDFVNNVEKRLVHENEYTITRSDGYSITITFYLFYNTMMITVNGSEKEWMSSIDDDDAFFEVIEEVYDFVTDKNLTIVSKPVEHGNFAKLWIDSFSRTQN
ncbi:hypothetical protein IO44_04570 [Gallibacterium anatis str. Avicor]|uniref:hypothetical protein n=1 Tax=Gallibacterium anatis TaxID=750 RepID=UPI00053142ED|nr:hypothetical protein [Gallibacterium anatis]KGQ55936.1 hypothetical protein IO44_04570 [Gallibacterium anatis str. Avicor]